MSNRPLFRGEVHVSQDTPPSHADLNAALDVIEADVICLDSHVFGGRQMRDKEPTTGLQILQFTTAEVNDTAYETYVNSRQIIDHLKPLFPKAEIRVLWYDEDAQDSSFNWDEKDEKPDEPDDEDGDG